ncbi:uncharacterized protein LOC135429009 [Drosophila montana]|uniref:uncharacterized protein LOC135429009 n=1 Tax=Drosophila montana TaxID=40370 RepID=UPI00313F3130
MFPKDVFKKKLRKSNDPATTGRLPLEAGETQRKLRNLNRQFERDILRLENSISNLEVPDKSLASAWVGKLKTRPPNINEALARNYILTYLLQSTQVQMFKMKPFCKSPPTNTLSKIKAVMPPIMIKTKNVKELYQNSFDNGAFLNKLPVPRDGAFFVLHLRPNLN